MERPEYNSFMSRQEVINLIKWYYPADSVESEVALNGQKIISYLLFPSIPYQNLNWDSTSNPLFYAWEHFDKSILIKYAKLCEQVYIKDQLPPFNRTIVD